MPPVDPCGAGVALVHGPVTLDPDPGAPAQDGAVLSVPEPGFFCVAVTTDRISSTLVTLDGSPLWATDDFNATVTETSRVAPVMPPEAHLEWTVRATPLGSLTYEVRFTPLDPAPRGLVTGSNGRLAVSNLQDGPDPFSPADGNGVRDALSLAVTVEVDPSGISTSSATVHLLRYSFQIASSVSCTEVRTLTAAVAVTSATLTTPSGAFRLVLLAEWDGRDALGALVPDGTYFYRAAVDLVRRTPAGIETLRDSALSEILATHVDNTAPEILIARPTADVNSVQDPLVRFTGLVEDASDVELIEAAVTSAAGTTDFQAPIAGDTFDLTVLLDEGTDPVFEQNEVALTATDEAGNTGLVIRSMALFREFDLDQVGVAFEPGVSEATATGLITAFGGTVREHVPELNLYWVGLPATETVESALAHFEGLPEVSLAAPNFFYQTNSHARVTPADFVTSVWNDVDVSALNVVSAFEAWSHTTGSTNVVVAVIDTGVDILHPDLQGVPNPCLGNLFINAAEDLDGDCLLTAADLDGVDNDGNTYDDDVIGIDMSSDVGEANFAVPTFQDTGPDPDLSDLQGHGTAVAGVIGAIGNNLFGTTGVNWDVSILPIRIGIGNSRFVDTAGGIRAMFYASRMNADVINLSWGFRSSHDEEDFLLFQAMSIGGLANTVIVAAAGNDGNRVENRESFPSGYDLPNIIAVAATEQDTFELGELSNYGATEVDIAAPGVPRHLWTIPCDPAVTTGCNSPAFVTTLPAGRITPMDCYRLPSANCDATLGSLGTLVPSFDNDYGDFAYTSAATPVVAGAAALVKAVNPALTAQQIKSILLACADRHPSLAGKVLSEGRLNIACAVDVANDPPPSIALFRSELESTFNEYRVSDFAFDPTDPEGDLWAASSFDNSVHVFFTLPDAGGSTLNVELTTSANVHAVEFSPDGMLLAAAGNENNAEVRVYDRAGPLIYTHDVNANARSLVWTSDSAFLVVGANGGRLVVLDRTLIDDGDPSNDGDRFKEDDRSGDYLDLSFSADGNLLAIASTANEVVLYDTSDLADPAAPLGSPTTISSGLFGGGNVNAVAFDPSDVSASPLLAFGGNNERVDFCSVTMTLTLCFETRATSKDVDGIAWSPNGRLVAIGEDDDRALVLNTLMSGFPIIFTTGGEVVRPVRAVAFNALGSILAVGSRNKLFGTFLNANFYSITPPQGP